MTTAPIVEVSGLTKVFRDFWRRPRVRAVDSIAFEIRRYLRLLGPNGSGKSTTIKMILGCCTRLLVACRFLVRPDDVAVKAHRLLPEESYLYRFLDARETLDYYGKLAWRPTFANAGPMNSCKWLGWNGWPTVPSANTPKA